MKTVSTLWTSMRIELFLGPQGQSRSAYNFLRPDTCKALHRRAILPFV
uniref:Uncharacterized protein n=1 Tax=Arundo donax TaxID=35708 RepID=A0A0A8XRH5_ARUDO